MGVGSVTWKKKKSPQLKFDSRPESEDDVIGIYSKRNGQIDTDHVKNKTVKG